jgi:hypothetical protein
LKDNEREDRKETQDHVFGEHGWGEAAGDKARDKARGNPGEQGTGWQGQFARQNADKYGQAGGQPMEQRGPAQSTGGQPQEETNVGDTKDLSPRGGVGIRETEKRPNDKK